MRNNKKLVLGLDGGMVVRAWAWKGMSGHRTAAQAVGSGWPFNCLPREVKVFLEQGNEAMNDRTRQADGQAS